MSALSSAEVLAKAFEMKQGLAQLFERAMRDGRTPPLEALDMLARALGGLYREVADLHRHPAGCPCGWTPTDRDLAALAEALRQGAGPTLRAAPDIHTMEPAGRA